MASQPPLEIDAQYADGLIPSRGQLPQEPEPANYVVIDVTHYSTTVLELFDAGAEYVHVPEERGDEFAFQEDHPDAKIGGGSSDDYTPTEGYDFFNSPSYVHEVDVDGRPTAITSTNGGAAVTDLRKRGGDDIDIYVGATANAAAVADHLRGDDKPTIPVAAGSKLKPSPEDTVGAVLIRRYLDGNPPSEAELAAYQEIIEAGKLAKYVDKADIRVRDLLEYSKRIDVHTAVPKLEGQRLVDVAGDGEERNEPSA
ncbi:2-phosphosulfolactate phosphatase [Haloterrigena salifodinae]|uniref:2-phosphosulfolactate phosphatase n=1 Tax=Haloterrigena salifodinae TaxID=2675099 RepID=UPI000F87F282|nr:2-phosphosulfolactate phosphatase [Haloterrigena salifodinae]